jgi:transcriptional regulator with GAF, ATPase, and Fis domain
MDGEVHRSIAELARDMHRLSSSEDNVDAVVASITAGAVSQVHGAQFAGVLLVDKKKNFETIGLTDPVVQTLDTIQKEADEGPCLEAAWEHSTVRMNNFDDEPRWPAFAARAVRETAVRSSLSFQLFTHEGAMGALNLFSEKSDAFSRESEELGLIYATHAALALFRARQEEQFKSALASRDLIGQAKGVIMERFSVDAIQAFDLLRKLSQDSNIPLVKVAQKLIEAR